MSLSERLRPDVEAAPWVIEEVKALEDEIERLQNKLVATATDLDLRNAEIEWMRNAEIGWMRNAEIEWMRKVREAIDRKELRE